jgi:flavin reductase (DIM6/NTAB) family NADH-FMN oxidoreductase RutF
LFREGGSLLVRRFGIIVQLFFRFRQGGDLLNLPILIPIRKIIELGRFFGETMSLSQVSQIWAEVDPAIWLVTSGTDDAQGGMIATFVNQASIAPECPRMLVGLSHQHHTRQLVETSGAFAIHLFEEDHLDWVWQFGLQSGWAVDKLQDVPFDVGTTGSPLLKEARAWLDCRVESRLNTGDRTIYLAEVIDAYHRTGGPILTVHRMLQLAPPDKLQLLDELHERDERIDGQAIQAWRNQQSGNAP